jgi:hypothetical protein
MSLVPIVAYKVFLTIALGSTGSGTYATDIQLHPYGGIFTYYPWNPEQVEEIRSVYFPGIICGCVALWALSKRLLMPRVWVLLCNIVVFEVLLAPAATTFLTSVGRITDGVVLAAVFCIPDLDELTNRNRSWLWSSTVLWLSLMPFWLLVPIADSFAKSWR